MKGDLERLELMRRCNFKPAGIYWRELYEETRDRLKQKEDAMDAKIIERSLTEIEEQLAANEGYFVGHDLVTLQILQGHIKDRVREIRKQVKAAA
jgi:hypothetical protein